MERNYLAMSLEAIMTVFSEEFTSTILVFLSIFFLTYYINSLNIFHVENDGPPPLPPTIRSFPVLGSLLCLPRYDNLHRWLLDKSDTLGYIIGFYAGRRYAVTLQRRQLVDEALLKKAVPFASRPSTCSRQLFNPSVFGIIDRPYNDPLKKYRRLSVNVMNHLGLGTLGKGLIESHIQLATIEAVEKIKELNGAPFDPRNLIAGSMMSILWIILFGHRLDSSDVQLQEMLCWIQEFFRRGHYAVIADLFPLLRFFPKIRRELSAMKDAQNKLLKRLGDSVDRTLSDEKNPSFVGCFRKDEGPDFDREELLFLLRDLVFAGAKSTPTVLQWAVLLLANHPEIQQRCQQQIDSVISTDRLPALCDRPSLPYIEATIHEVMRCKTIEPMSVPHETSRDTYLAGHCIPAGTLVEFLLHVTISALVLSKVKFR